MQYRFCVAIILAGVAIISQAKAEEYASPLLRAAGSGARLVSAGAFQNERYLTGVEIQLDPRTITYWRQPENLELRPILIFQNQRMLQRLRSFSLSKAYHGG